MNMTFKRWSSLLLCTLLVASLIAACSSNGTTTENTASNTSGSTTEAEKDESTPAEPAGPVKISVFARQNSAEALAEDHPILLELERLTNSDLDITWIPVNTLAEKTKITLASGDMNDMMYIENTTDSQFVTAAEQGAFWDITPYIAEYENLSALPAEMWENAKIRGKLYGVPRPRPMEGTGVMPLVRMDWLDKLGLEMPKTIDELYAAAKAISEGDPDGNGKVDTYGLTGNVDPGGMGTFSWVEQVFTMTPGNWQLVDGKLQPKFFDPNMKLALEWLHKAYTEKVIPPDFAVLKYNQARDNFMGNKAGFLGSSIKPQWLFMEALLKLDPNGDIAPMVSITGPNGEYAGEKGIGFYGMYAIPKSVPEAKMKQILGVMDKGATDEVGNLAQFGLKDVHYTVKDGDTSYIIATEKAEADNIGAITNNTSNLFANYNKYYYGFYPGIPEDHYARNKQTIDERAKLSIPKVESGLISDTYLLIGPDLEKKLQDLKVKIIMGDEPMSAWDDAVNDLKQDAQLQKAIDEMTEAYNNK